MSIPTIKAGARYYKVTTGTPDLPGAPYLEIGPAGTTSGVSTHVVMFRPRLGWTGTFTVMGRTLGSAADDIDVPFVPIPYRLASLNNVAQTYQMVSDPIIGTAIIRIPASGLTVALFFAVTAGICDLTMWDLMGDAAP